MSSIVVSELEYAPPGADSLFFGVGFGVAPGEHAALVGANGVGKSTILRILSGELDADEGEFALGGTVLTMTQDVGMSRPNDTLRDMLIEVAPAALRTAGRAMVIAERAMYDGTDDGMLFAEAITHWGDMGGYDYAVSGRIGIEGGTADDIARSLKETIHDLFGAGNAKLVSENDTKFLGGVSGWVRTEYDLGGPGPWAMSLDPYAHAALGLDSVEVGAGLMLVFQPPAETRGLAPLMPKTGAYAPAFGGDGFGIFAGVRGVAYEGLYEDLAEPFLAEAGITAQVTLWDFAVIGAAASCTTPPYETTKDPDCKVNFQMGGLF